MRTINKAVFIKDTASRKVKITRSFNAPIEMVWSAWTEQEKLDQWWAPKPWKAETKKMDFRVGGSWLYCMVGPDGTRSWCKADYTEIIPQKSFKGTDYFCDEEGNINNEFPLMHWYCVFTSSAEGTDLVVEMSFDNDGDMEKIIELGFEQGFTAALENLDDMLA